MKTREEILKARQDRLDHISNSFEKATEAPIGTVATHGGKKMKKVGPGKWEPVKEENKKDVKIDASKLSKKELYDVVNEKYHTTFKPGDIEEFEDDEFRPELTDEDIKNIVEDETK